MIFIWCYCKIIHKNATIISTFPCNGYHWLEILTVQSFLKLHFMLSHYLHYYTQYRTTQIYFTKNGPILQNTFLYFFSGRPSTKQLKYRPPPQKVVLNWRCWKTRVKNVWKFHSCETHLASCINTSFSYLEPCTKRPNVLVFFSFLLFVSFSFQYAITPLAETCKLPGKKLGYFVG